MKCFICQNYRFATLDKHNEGEERDDLHVAGKKIIC